MNRATFAKHNIVHHEGFRFCKDKAANEVSYFRCTNYKEGCMVPE